MNNNLMTNVEVPTSLTKQAIKSRTAHAASIKRINARHNLLNGFLSERKRYIPTPAENNAAPI